MNIVGRLVISTAGRDKGSVLVVLDMQEEYLLLADGRQRKVQNPKRKKLKHTVLIEDAAIYSGSLTNKEIHRYIREYYKVKL